MFGTTKFLPWIDTSLEQLSKGRSILLHLYPGIVITIVYVILVPLLRPLGYPPQFALLITIAVAAVPVMILHLFNARTHEKVPTIFDLNGLTHRIKTWQVALYSLLLVIAAFVIWGATDRLSVLINENLLNWLPDWYTAQNFDGYDLSKVKTTLILNFVLNGFVAPFVEELYFRGYLLPRMNSWGNAAFFYNAVFFSLYHFWQPSIYITLILALLPMTYVVSRTKDLRVAIATHCLLNIIGAGLTFASLK